MVHVSTLVLTGNGTVQVDTSGEVIAGTATRGLNTSLSLLSRMIRMPPFSWFLFPEAEKSPGSAGGLQLQDQTGKFITDSVQHAIIQNGQKVAKELMTIA